MCVETCIDLTGFDIVDGEGKSVVLPTRPERGLSTEKLASEQQSVDDPEAGCSRQPRRAPNMLSSFKSAAGARQPYSVAGYAACRWPSWQALLGSARHDAATGKSQHVNRFPLC